MLKMARPGVIRTRVDKALGLGQQVAISGVAEVGQAGRATVGMGENTASHGIAARVDFLDDLTHPQPVNQRIAIRRGYDTTRMARQ